MDSSSSYSGSVLSSNKKKGAGSAVSLPDTLTDEQNHTWTRQASSVRDVKESADNHKTRSRRSGPTTVVATRNAMSGIIEHISRASCKDK